MPEQITRESGVILTRDPKTPNILHVRYNSDNMKNVTGTIRPEGDEWRVLVDLPSPTLRPRIAAPPDVLTKPRVNPVTLPEAIQELEGQIRRREVMFDEHNRNVAHQEERHHQEIDKLFGEGG